MAKEYINSFILILSAFLERLCAVATVCKINVRRKHSKSRLSHSECYNSLATNAFAAKLDH
jgi:hypothetical protein